MADTPVQDSLVGLETIQEFNLQDPRTLKVFSDNLIKPKSFLKDFFFPTSAADMFATESVLIDNMKRGRKAAPFVIRGAKVSDRDTFLTDEYKPPRIAPARVLKVDDLKKRGFGESLFNGKKPNERAVLYTLQDLQEMNDEITRREEIMCAETLLNNSCVMKHIDADGGADTETHTIKFFEGEDNPQVYTPAKSWTDTTADILGDIAAMRKAVTKTGNRADVLLVSPDVAEDILSNTEIRERLNNRRYDVGDVAPVALPAGAVEVCRLKVDGAVVTVVSYEETYENDAGDDVAYLPEGTAIMTAYNCGRGLYGGVVQLEEGSDEFQYYESRRVPKVIVDRKTDEKTVQMVARPVMVPAAKGAWVSAKVVLGG
jgi:hypothetical protein